MNKQLQETAAQKVVEIFRKRGIDVVEVNVHFSGGSMRYFTKGKPGFVANTQPTVVLRASLARQHGDSYASRIINVMPLMVSGFDKTWEAATKKALAEMASNLDRFLSGLSDTHRGILLRAVPA